MESQESESDISSSDASDKQKKNTGKIEFVSFAADCSSPDSLLAGKVPS